MQTANDPCLYMASEGEMVISIYVDDIAIAAKSDAQMAEALAEWFEMRDMGELDSGGEGRSISKHWRGLDWPGGIYEVSSKSSEWRMPMQSAHQLTPV